MVLLFIGCNQSRQHIEGICLRRTRLGVHQQFEACKGCRLIGFGLDILYFDHVTPPLR